ncbi:MAG: ABC transporter substrate-binding protein [Chitinophagales bacterium]|nr:ABC transporter substrate-binding protein [Chitinophagales bacterium]
MIFTDQLRRDVLLSFPPKRIISLVPSQSELLFDLGLNEEIIGVTKFCIRPKEKTKSRIKIGGTKDINLEKVKSLYPDLIIGNKEENNEEQVKELMKEFPVWMSNIRILEEAYEMIISIGKLVEKYHEASSLVSEIKFHFKNLNSNITGPQPYKTTYKNRICYLIWRNPYMTVGADTFINDMLKTAGFENIFSGKTRYPVIELQEISDLTPDYIFLSSEPYPFKENHVQQIQNMLPLSKVLLVDGEMFSWYGSRLLKSAAYFLQLHKKLKV